MIPFIFVSLPEFKKIICCKYSILRYLFVLLWYCFLFCFCFIIYFFQLWDFSGAFGNHIWKEQTYFDIYINVSVLVGISIFICSYIVKSIFFVLKDKNQNEIMESGYKNNICILIACHNSSDIIEDTILSIIKYFDGNQVYLCDNNKIKGENEKNTEQIALKYNCNYNFYNIPNKTNAIRSTLKENIDKYKYVILLDDDTCLSDNFCLKEDSFKKDDNLIGIGFGIRMKKREENLITRLVDCEYLYFTYNKYIQNFATNKFICGIGGIWKTDKIYEILKINPADGSILPFGEDGWNGLITRLNGYRIKQDIQNFVESSCPTDIFFSFGNCFNKVKCISGYDSTNLWKQRSLRWYRSGVLRIVPEIYTLFTYNAGLKDDSIIIKILRNIFYRVIILWGLTLNYFSAIVPILFINYINDPIRYGLIHLSLLLISVLCNIYIRFFIFRNRDDLQMGWDVLLLQPFFKFLISLMRTFGFVGTLLYYFPFKITPRVFTCHQIKNEEEVKKIDKPLDNMVVIELKSINS